MSWFTKWEPKIERAITRAELYPILIKAAPGAKIYYQDRDYFIPADPLNVMERVRSWSYTYKKASRDCDDFVRIFRGRLSEMGFGNLLAMDCIIDYFSKSQNKTVRHAVIAFLHNDEIIFGEPQKGKLVTYGEVKILRLVI